MLGITNAASLHEGLNLVNNAFSKGSSLSLSLQLFKPVLRGGYYHYRGYHSQHPPTTVALASYASPTSELLTLDSEPLVSLLVDTLPMPVHN